MHGVQDVVVRALEQRLAPERLVAVADEEVLEGEAGGDRAERQQQPAATSITNGLSCACS